MRKLALLTLLCVLPVVPGCLALSLGGRTVTETAPPAPPRDTSHISDVWGYGTGPNETDATKAAWDDAVARMKEMGLADGQRTVKATPEAKPFTQTHGGTVDTFYKASVHLEISR